MRRGIRLKHLNRSGEYPSGNARFYFRPKGQKGKPLPDLPMGHPQWLAKYVELSGMDFAPDAIPSGALGKAIVKYKDSDHFTLLADNTKSVRRRCLDRIAKAYGNTRELTPEVIARDLKGFTRHAQHTQLKAWRGLCKFLKTEGLLKTDPSRSDQIERAPVPQSDGHEPWTRDEIELFRKFYPSNSPERLAFELLYFTGASMVDATKLGRGCVGRDGWLSYKRQKTNSTVEIPFARSLPEFAKPLEVDLQSLKRSIEGQGDRHMTFMVTKQGHSRSPKSASQWFSKKAQRAGVKKTAHGLRKSRDMELAELGGSAAQLMGWLGHETLEQATHYIKKFDQRRALSDSRSGSKAG
jgi:integrase